MGIGKAGISFDINKLSLKFGNLNIIQNGKVNSNYNEAEASDYMKESNIDLIIDISDGSKALLFTQWI